MKNRNQYELFKKYVLVSSKLKGMKDNNIPVITNKLDANGSEYEVVMIGSKAISFHTFNPRAEKDIDIIGPMDNIIRFTNEALHSKYNHCKVNEMSISFHGDMIVECQPVFEDDPISNTSKELWEHRKNFHWFKVGKFTVYVPTLLTLYMIKLSHRYKPGVHFSKTMNDIKYLRNVMNEKGIDFSSECLDHDFIERRRREYVKKADYKLNVSKSEFFTSNFDYVYDHDTIHEAVALNGHVPAYTKYTTEEVYSSKELFFKCSEEVRIQGVLEECYTLAIERVYVPNINNKDFVFNPYTAFVTALNKVCTTITSGWFREYAWENYDLMISHFESEYIDKFKYALENGNIKPYKGI